MADEVTTTTADTTTEAAADETVQAEQQEAQATNDGSADDDSTALGGKVDDVQAEDAKPALPEKYELTLKSEDGEEVALDTDMLAEADPVFREIGLDNEQANKLMPVAQKFADKTRDNVLQQVQDLAKQQSSDWLKLAKSDDAIGGDKWDETLELSAKAMDALGFNEQHPFRQFLAETGLGNHRDMLFAFRKFGETVAEDKFPRGEGVGSSADLAKKLYPND